jgi:2,4-dienoyl-CoA reductase-like NADH-dependent reductase (Old Yellow Enzyme family)
MSERPPLIAAVAAFLEQHNMPPVTFGRKALNDPHFVRDLRNGRRLWPDTEAKVRRFMATYSAKQTASEAA